MQDALSEHIARLEKQIVVLGEHIANLEEQFLSLRTQLRSADLRDFERGEREVDLRDAEETLNHLRRALKLDQKTQD